MNKIKIAMVATNLKLNGISAVIMNYIDYIDLSKFDITLLVGQGVAQIYRQKCKKKDVKIIELPPRKEKPIAFYINLYKEFLLGHYRMVHVHGSNASIGMELLLAKLANIHIRIAHSHNTTSTSIRIHKLMKPVFNRVYTNGFACGYLAGRWLFDNKKFTIIPNGVRINDFIFNPKVRSKEREKLNLKGKYVIGHIGRFNYQKNHEFILKVFEKVLVVKPNAVLLLVGNGPDFRRFKKIIIKKGLEDKIILYGETNKAHELYMAMDSFLFPSRFEGFPVTLIEAQISGLPCLVSDVISGEVQLSSNLQFMSLGLSADKWAQKLVSLSSDSRELFYIKHKSKINHYKIDNDVKILENEYIKILDGDQKYGLEK